ncbi:MAG TPA: hypothetical protein VLK33_23095, partial [Terriglobales bacterium]|nr:hypothetical protein [Terriglobales bacterium]
MGCSWQAHIQAPNAQHTWAHTHMHDALAHLYAQRALCVRAHIPRPDVDVSEWYFCIVSSSQ